MSIIVKEKAGEFHAVKPANYQAVCYGIWDIGLQKGKYKEETKITHQIVIGFELNERIESQDDYNGKRYRINSFYNLSLGKKANLRKDLASWRGRDFTKEELDGFDVESILGANCFLNVILKENGKPRVSAITSVPKGIPKIAPEMGPDMPEWIQKLKDRAVEPELAAAEPEGSATEDDSIPF